LNADAVALSQPRQQSGENMSGATMNCDHETDVLVIGYGFAGATAAIECADAGLSVLIVEKMPDPGGISICSAGAVRSAQDAGDAFAYLQETCGGRTPDDVLQGLARGMAEAPAYLQKLADACNATVSSSLSRTRAGGNYPLPGWETFFHVLVDEIPGFDAASAYPHVRGLAAGRRLFHLFERNIAARPGISIWLESPARRLTADGEPGAAAATGALVERDGQLVRVRARRGVVLACGGFECDEETKRQMWQMFPVLPAMGRQNTGDGLRMAQQLGARLWHMWHFHGAYGFRDPSGAFPYGLRLKRLPDWVPGEDARTRAPMSWILVDQTGRRFMNENPPYTQDTSARPFEYFDTMTQTFPRIPAHFICDDAGLKMYRLCDPCYNERGISFEWKDDNSTGLELGILKKADTVGELAALIGVDPETLEVTLQTWNGACDSERDAQFGRLPGSFTPVRTPPFYTAEVWPVVSNTQGGPVHDASQRVIGVDGEPIAGLYAVGELGSAFGHLYMSGGNISECLISGRLAARDIAGQSSDAGAVRERVA